MDAFSDKMIKDWVKEGESLKRIREIMDELDRTEPEEESQRLIYMEKE